MTGVADDTTHDRQRVITEALVKLARRSGWDSLSSYIEHHLVEHAVEGLCLDRVLRDSDALDHLEQTLLASVCQQVYFGLPNAPQATLDILMTTDRLPYHGPAGRRDLRTVARLRRGEPRDPLAGLRPWSPIAVVGKRLIAHAVLLGLVRAVCAVVVDGRQLLVAEGWDGMVWLWDPVTGVAVGEPFAGHSDSVFAVCAVVVDGRQLVVSAGADDTVRLWDPVTGQAVRELLTGHPAGVANSWPPPARMRW
jgi:hypothetical protein